jgi:T5SS/PEP-CTERM-associated repeat protein
MPALRRTRARVLVLLAARLALFAGAPSISEAQVVQWGNDPSKIGLTEVGTWFPTGGGSKWSCPFPTPCVPPNSGTESVRIGYLAYDTFRGISPPGLPLNGNVQLNADARVGQLFLGQGARGQLDISGHNLATSSVSVGSLSARDMRGVLQPGIGVLNLTGGGSINSSASVFLGSATAETQGTVLVTGSGTTWSTSGALYDGYFGVGEFRIAAGGAVTARGGHVGFAAGSQGSLFVDGPSSRLVMEGSGLGVGYDGQGTVRITRGATAELSGMLLGGFRPDARGTVVVEGSGSRLSTGSAIIVGQVGQGTLNILGGAKVTTGRVAVVGGYTSAPPANALVDGSGSDWTVSGQMQIGYSGGPGYVKVRNGGHLSTISMFIGHNGTLDIDPATVEVLGDFTLLPGGTLAIGVEGDTPGLFSQLLIGGVGLFQGSVFIDFLNGFAPSAGQSFSLITAAGGADFSQATIAIRGLAPGFQYSTAYAGGTWSLTALTSGVSATIPEPRSAALLASGLGVMSALARRRRREHASGWRRRRHVARADDGVIRAA